MSQINSKFSTHTFVCKAHKHRKHIKFKSLHNLYPIFFGTYEHILGPAFTTHIEAFSPCFKILHQEAFISGRIRVAEAFCSFRSERIGETSPNGGKQYTSSSVLMFCWNTFTLSHPLEKYLEKNFNFFPNVSVFTFTEDAIISHWNGPNRFQTWK